jgi:hypothetical protein
MPFTGHENHAVNLDDAAKMTEAYRESQKPGAFLGGYFGKDAIQKILVQSGCVGMRIYNGMDNSESPTFVLVGVDAEGEDMTGGELAEIQIGCPPICPIASELTGTA